MKVGKFFPKTLTAKSRWRKQSKESLGSAASNEEDARGRGLARVAALDDSTASLPTTTSNSNHDLDDADEGDPGDFEYTKDAVVASERSSDHDS